MFEEWSGEVHISPVLQGIPLISPPLVLVIDLHLRVWTEVRDDGLPSEIARAVVEVSLIAPCETAPLPAVGAVCGGRDRIGLPRECWGDCLIEREILLRDLEC